MALDPRISMGTIINKSNPVKVFNDILAQNQARELNASREERAVAQEDDRSALAPLLQQQQQQNVDINQQTLGQNRDAQRLANLNQTGQRLKPFLESGDNQGAQKFMLDNISAIQGRIEQGSNEDVTESMETLARLQSGDTEGVLNDVNAISKLSGGNSNISTGQREFESALLMAQDPNATEFERNSAKRKLGGLAKVGITAQERIAADRGLTDSVASSQSIIEGSKESAKEGSKLKQQLKHKPAIAKAVKLAEKEAVERGDTLTDLTRMEASLPGVKEVVSELIDLSSIATSTLGGKAFDFAVKQSGFGSTKGADARSKMIAIVDNQVLPLLKETFGAAFTVAEGDNLKASLVDPDASPSAKRAQLSAFLAQKERNVRTKQNQIESGNEEDEFSGFKVVR